MTGKEITLVFDVGLLIELLKVSVQCCLYYKTRANGDHSLTEVQCSDRALAFETSVLSVAEIIDFCCVRKGFYPVWRRP